METTRRTFFIRGAGAAAAAYRAAGAAPKLNAAGPNDAIGVGFIGVGIRGSYHLENFHHAPGVRAVIAADCFDGHLDYAKEATGSKIETTRDYQAVLSRKDVDAVVIATPDHWHARMVLDALAAGKHVYVEKPMTHSVEEGKKICDAADGSGKLVMVGAQGKTSPLVAKARELIKSGALGKVNMVRMGTFRNSPEGAWVYPIPEDASPRTIDWQRWLGSAPKRPFEAKHIFRWRCWWEYSGGVATDLWVHALTALHEMMDIKGPLSVVAQGGIFRFDDGRTCPDLLTGLYEYPGFMAEITADLGNSSRGDEFVIMGSEGTLRFGPGGVMVSYEPVPSPLAASGLNGWTKAAREKYVRSIYPGGQPTPLPPNKPAQTVAVERGLEHWEHFIKSLRDGTPSLETAEDGHRAAAAAHLGNLAYRQKRRIGWDAETSQVKEG